MRKMTRRCEGLLYCLKKRKRKKGLISFGKDERLPTGSTTGERKKNHFLLCFHFISKQQHHTNKRYVSCLRNLFEGMISCVQRRVGLFNDSVLQADGGCKAGCVERVKLLITDGALSHKKPPVFPLPGFLVYLSQQVLREGLANESA